MVVAWIVSVWLLSLAVFVALRAYGTRNHRKRRAAGAGGTARPAELPGQRESWDSPARVTKR